MTATQTEVTDASVTSQVGHQSLPCAHCGLPTPCHVDSDPVQVFCCNGCRGAYELIRGWGLENFYALRDESIGENRVAEKQSRYDVFDSDEFLGDSRPLAVSDGLLTAELALHGLHCAACAWLIENAAVRKGGWKSARVKMSDHSIRVVFDPSRIRLSQIAQLLDRLGYELAPLTGDRDDSFRIQNQRLLTQIAIAAFCAANAMWIAVALYAGATTGAVASHGHFLRLIGTGLGLAAVLFPGRTFFVGALASLRTRTPHMDLPIALGLSVGTTVGLINAIMGRGDVYFDSLAVLVFLLLVGRWIQFRQQHRASKSIDLLLRITPRHANRVTLNGDREWVLVDNLRSGDIVHVAAGESLPVDGEIIVGDTLINASLLTGESEPVVAKQGDDVCAGTVNMTRPIKVRVCATGRESRIGQVMESVEQASAGKTPIVQLGDRIGGVFVVVVTLLALTTFASWVGSGWAVAAANSTALLIVACPCALALATPLAIAVSLGRAAKESILIRDGSSLQRLARPGMIWFDKTGTLTEGHAEIEFLAGSQTAIALAAEIESECNHPIAQGILRYVNLEPATDSHTTVKVENGGVCGQSNGQHVCVGSLAYLTSKEAEISDAMLQAADKCLMAGRSPVLIAIDGVAVTVLQHRDSIKHAAREVITDLQDRGWTVGILSGDHGEIVRRVANELGIASANALGGLSPEEKLQIVRRPHYATVVMVGDGANDAAALAAADVGIAVRGGAEVSLQAAPIFIASGKLTSITQLIAGCRRTMWLIAAAFAASLSYNLFAVTLAMAGHISPLLAAILMPISSITVLALAFAWPTIRPLSAEVES